MLKFYGIKFEHVLSNSHFSSLASVVIQPATFRTPDSGIGWIKLSKYIDPVPVVQSNTETIYKDPV